MDDAQRVAAKIALAVLAADGFILAGGQALIEHGITNALQRTSTSSPCTAATPRQPSPHRYRK